MTYQDRPVSEGPARDDPELGDTLSPAVPPAPGPGAVPAAGADGPPREGQDAPSTGRERAAEVSGAARERAGEVTGAARDRAGEVSGAARERAGEVATTARDEARSVAGTAGSEARGVAREAEDQARRLAQDTRDELRSQADAQIARLADGLDDLTRQLRSMGERGDPGPATDLVRQAAGQAGRLPDHLRNGGVDDAVGQVRDFGRNRPGLFLLGAFGLGLVGGRMARNLAQGADGDGSGSQPQPGDDRYAAPADEDRYAAPAGDDRYAVPAAGHAAYGAPSSNEPWGV